MAKTKQTLLRTIQERKLQYFGHLIRGKGKQKLHWKERQNGQDAEESKEGLGQMM